LASGVGGLGVVAGRAGGVGAQGLSGVGAQEFSSFGAQGLGCLGAQWRGGKHAASTSQGAVHPVHGRGRASSFQPYNLPRCSTSIDVDIDSQPIDSTGDNLFDSVQHDNMVILFMHLCSCW
jgi:hypothetical protein